MASHRQVPRVAAAFCFMAGMLLAVATAQEPFTSSYLDGGAWPEEGLYGQGFNAFVNDNPEVMYDFGDPITLSRFEFFKSGNEDDASDIQLAIVSDFFLNLETFTTASEELVGLSSNTIANTDNLTEGDPIRFDFEDLTINFGDYYGAILVNVAETGAISPVLVSAIHANYVEVEPDVWEPETNYDFDPENPTDYLTSASSFINTEDEFGDYLVGFEGSGDANFVAYYNYSFASAGPGDFDEDGDVDGDDLTTWQAAYGVSGDADADEDGDSDGVDFLIWQRNVNNATIAAVPEPASAMLAVLAVGFFGRWRLPRQAYQNGR